VSNGHLNPEPTRRRDADLIETFVWLALLLGGLAFVIYQCPEYVAWLLAPAMVVVPAVFVWGVTKYYRKRRHVTKLKTRLKRTIDTYGRTKESTASLPPPDREQAARQLEALKQSGWSICRELTQFRTELWDAKQAVLTRLSDGPADLLAKKLEPIRVQEIEINRLLRDFEPLRKDEG
jgi:hypothetical protein